MTSSVVQGNPKGVILSHAAVNANAATAEIVQLVSSWHAIAAS